VARSGPLAVYRSVLRAELPGARIVADRFHVIADANRRLDETRRLEGGALGEALPRWPLPGGQRRPGGLALGAHPAALAARDHGLLRAPHHQRLHGGLPHQDQAAHKRPSYGYRNVQVYLRKMLLGFLPVSHAVLAPHLLA
jgi:hypothetical protein